MNISKLYHNLFLQFKQGHTSIVIDHCVCGVQIRSDFWTLLLTNSSPLRTSVPATTMPDLTFLHRTLHLPSILLPYRGLMMPLAPPVRYILPFILRHTIAILRRAAASQVITHPTFWMNTFHTNIKLMFSCVLSRGKSAPPHAYCLRIN